MRSRLPIGLVLGALSGIAAALFTLNLPDPGRPEGAGRVPIGGPFTLTDTSGARRTEKDFLGKPMLVFFGFTHCPDICPSGLQTLTAALNELGDKAEKITPIFVSVDPERDTPDVLGRYLKSFHPRIQGLTGSVEDVQAATKVYRVYAKKVPSDTVPSDYSVDHSTLFYLMDSSGAYLKHFPHGTKAEDLAKALAAAL